MAGRRSPKTVAGSARRALKIRSGDQVLVRAGKDRGKTGKVLRVEPRKEHVYIEGLNMIKKHTRPKQVPGAGGGFGGAGTGTVGGGVIELEGPIHVSNLMLLDPKDGRPTRVGVERENGKPYRVARRTGARID